MHFLNCCLSPILDLIKLNVDSIVADQVEMPVIEQVINNVKIDTVIDAEKVLLVNEIKLKEKRSFINL